MCNSLEYGRFEDRLRGTPINTKVILTMAQQDGFFPMEHK